MKNSAKTIYRLAAIVAGIGWFVSIFANFVNGTKVFEFLEFVSTEQFEYHPMLDYWMKMAGLAFAFVGLGFLFCGMKWKKAFPLGIYFGIYQILSAISILLTMLRIDIDSQLYLLDCLFFFGTGIPMTLAWLSLKRQGNIGE